MEVKFKVSLSSYKVNNLNFFFPCLCYDDLKIGHRWGNVIGSIRYKSRTLNSQNYASVRVLTAIKRRAVFIKTVPLLYASQSQLSNCWFLRASPLAKHRIFKIVLRRAICISTWHFASTDRSVKALLFGWVNKIVVFTAQGPCEVDRMRTTRFVSDRLILLKEVINAHMVSIFPT